MSRLCRSTPTQDVLRGDTLCQAPPWGSSRALTIPHSTEYGQYSTPGDPIYLAFLPGYDPLFLCVDYWWFPLCEVVPSPQLQSWSYSGHPLKCSYQMLDTLTNCVTPASVSSPAMLIHLPVQPQRFLDKQEPKSTGKTVGRGFLFVLCAHARNLDLNYALISEQVNFTQQTFSPP